MKLYNFLVNKIIYEDIQPNSHFGLITDWSYATLLKNACKKNNVEFEKIAEGNFYFKKDGKYIGSVSNMISSLISSTSIHIAKNKKLTNKILSNAGLPVPKQKSFNGDQLDEARSYIINYPGKVVVKPLDAKGGEGISVNVDKSSNLDEILNYATHATLSKNKTILIEEMLDGIDIRVVVINGKFKCAASRIPSHVIGNGTHTINELIQQKNQLRRKMPYHKLHLIKESADNRIPQINEIVWLNEITNIAQGGEAMDLTDYLSHDIKVICEKAVKAIPGLKLAGVDLLANSLTDPSQVKILELNTYCNLTFNQYPYYGKGFNVFDSLIEETIKEYERFSNS
ncbi:sugar-transfer associated ATP-grasp domain-containing protein [Acinetobacter sp. ANC 7454]|uniref:sugar-transfer associated ATP-grasp domain-containing protein n=1 Tax=Acinetobacter thermotolerans TaxID=3151487 RepID=UPI00325AFA25